MAAERIVSFAMRPETDNSWAVEVVVTSRGRVFRRARCCGDGAFWSDWEEELDLPDLRSPEGPKS